MYKLYSSVKFNCQIYNSAPMISIYILWVYRDSLYHFTARNVDRETHIFVVTHFPFYIAVIIQRWIYDWLPTARVRAEDFVFKHMSLRVGDCAKSFRSRLTAAVRASYERFKIYAWPVLSLTVGTIMRSYKV